jgi:hypothetical protein
MKTVAAVRIVWTTASQSFRLPPAQPHPESPKKPWMDATTFTSRTACSLFVVALVGLHTLCGGGSDMGQPRVTVTVVQTEVSSEGTETQAPALF